MQKKFSKEIIEASRSDFTELYFGTTSRSDKSANQHLEFIKASSSKILADVSSFCLPNIIFLPFLLLLRRRRRSSSSLLLFVVFPFLLLYTTVFFSDARSLRTLFFAFHRSKRGNQTMIATDRGGAKQRKCFCVYREKFSVRHSRERTDNKLKDTDCEEKNIRKA